MQVSQLLTCGSEMYYFRALSDADSLFLRGKTLPSSVDILYCSPGGSEQQIAWEKRLNYVAMKHKFSTECIVWW